MRAARRAGKPPPKIPTKVAKTIPSKRIVGVILKWKSTSLKVEKFAVPVEMPCKGHQAARDSSEQGQQDR
jgi:hypothetical protein